MNRRGFLGALAGAAAFVADPERALWVPGKKLISIPRAVVAAPRRLKIGDTLFLRTPQRFIAREGLPYGPIAITPPGFYRVTVDKYLLDALPVAFTSAQCSDITVDEPLLEALICQASV